MQEPAPPRPPPPPAAATGSPAPLDSSGGGDSAGRLPVQRRLSLRAWPFFAGEAGPSNPSPARSAARPSSAPLSPWGSEFSPSLPAAADPLRAKRTPTDSGHPSPRVPSVDLRRPSCATVQERRSSPVHGGSSPARRSPQAAAGSRSYFGAVLPGSSRVEDEAATAVARSSSGRAGPRALRRRCSTGFSSAGLRSRSGSPAAMYAGGSPAPDNDADGGGAQLFEADADAGGSGSGSANASASCPRLSSRTARRPGSPSPLNQPTNPPFNALTSPAPPWATAQARDQSTLPRRPLLLPLFRAGSRLHASSFREPRQRLCATAVLEAAVALLLP